MSETDDKYVRVQPTTDVPLADDPLSLEIYGGVPGTGEVKKTPASAIRDASVDAAEVAAVAVAETAGAAAGVTASLEAIAPPLAQASLAATAASQSAAQAQLSSLSVTAAITGGGIEIVAALPTTGVNERLYLRYTDWKAFRWWTVRPPGLEGEGTPGYTAEGNWLPVLDRRTEPLRRMMEEGILAEDPRLNSIIETLGETATKKTLLWWDAVAALLGMDRVRVRDLLAEVFSAATVSTNTVVLLEGALDPENGLFAAYRTPSGKVPLGFDSLLRMEAQLGLGVLQQITTKILAVAAEGLGPISTPLLSLEESAGSEDVLFGLTRTISGKKPIALDRRDGKIDLTLTDAAVARLAAQLGASAPLPAVAAQPYAWAVRNDIGADVTRFMGLDEFGFPRPYLMRTIAAPTVAVEVTADKVLRITIRYGQSNALGARGTPIITTTPPLANSLVSFNTGIIGEENDAVDPATLTGFRPAYEAPSGNRGETGIVAGATWRALRRSAADARSVRLLRVSAAGDTDIAGLSLGSQPYANILIEVQKAIDLAPAYGCTRVVVDEIHWNQGGAERTMPRATYYALFVTLRSDLNAALMALTGQTQVPYWFIEHTGVDDEQGYTPQNTLAQTDLAVAFPTSVFVANPSYFFTGNIGFSSDGLHRVALGHAVQGEYTAKARERVERGQMMTCVRPIAPLVVAGNTVVERVSLPDGYALAVDTTTLPETSTFGVTGLYGFQMFGDTVTVTGVAFSPVNTTSCDIVVTLSGAPTASVPKLGYAMRGYSGPAGVLDRPSAWGNVRNTDPTPSRIDPGRALRDWMIAHENTPTSIW